jgi:hypothetical protein
MVEGVSPIPTPGVNLKLGIMLEEQPTRGTALALLLESGG